MVVKSRPLFAYLYKLGEIFPYFPLISPTIAFLLLYGNLYHRENKVAQIALKCVIRKRGLSSRIILS